MLKIVCFFWSLIPVKYVFKVATWNSERCFSSSLYVDASRVFFKLHAIAKLMICTSLCFELWTENLQMLVIYSFVLNVVLRTKSLLFDQLWICTVEAVHNHLRLRHALKHAGDFGLFRRSYLNSWLWLSEEQSQRQRPAEAGQSVFFSTGSRHKIIILWRIELHLWAFSKKLKSPASLCPRSWVYKVFSLRVILLFKCLGCNSAYSITIQWLLVCFGKCCPCVLVGREVSPGTSRWIVSNFSFTKVWESKAGNVR